MTRKKPEVEETIVSGAEVEEAKQTIVEKEATPQINVEVAAPEEGNADVHETRKAETVQTLIYVGPSLPGNVLPQYSSFTDGFPVQVKAEIEKCPFIQELIVPVGNLSQASANIGIKGTKEQVMYEKTIAFYKEASN
ncbi:hypothetical protein [Bacillus sp. Au-Bac7]|uniref:hypothetical protein n=1 Tax=Bacillus sp. Au-Bac7 TaxID=2906458 RepID=UPI001E2A8B71|nr:hypothetical protein [Bacillus sp. Au-Bac7]MCE4048025.1 hypothetical protein [Bacillus sp. Au-Bac7]